MAFSRLRKWLSHHDIADNLTTNDAAKVLSAKQGKELSDTVGHFRNASGGSENAASDADTIQNNGIYYRWYASGTNYPGTSGGFLIVTRHNSNSGYGTQLFIEDSVDQNVWVRRNNNGTWQAWQKLATDDKYTTVVVHGNCGALAAAAHGYITLNATIPNGYKTIGTCSITIGHPGVAGGLSLMPSVGENLTGSITTYVGYYNGSGGSIESNSTDFALLIQCVKA